MSRGTKIVLAILGGLGLLGVVAVVAIYFVWKTRGPEWQAQLREAGQQVMAEGKAAGASATKDECTRLGLARLRQDSSFMGQVKVALFTEYCLDEAQGSLAFCADAPKDDEILATATWRLKTSNALGLQDANNAVVKGIQKHCAGPAGKLGKPAPAKLRDCSQPAAFADSKLEATVRQALGMPSGDIGAAAMMQLKELEQRGGDVVSLAGLECFTALEKLDLSGNQIVDLSPLAALTNLNELRLGGNSVSDVAPLAGLSKLKVLRLEVNQISDATPLKALTGLTVLYLNDNRLRGSIEWVSGFTELGELSLGSSGIEDVTPLKGLSKLNVLVLHNNSISDVSPLSGLENLSTLILSRNRGLEDLGPLVRLKGLKRLALVMNDEIDCEAQAGNIAAIQKRGASVEAHCTSERYRREHRNK